jgi:beta-galactosidase
MPREAHSVFGLIFCTLLVSAQLCMGQMPTLHSTVTVNASALPADVLPTSFHGGTSIDPQGNRISMNDRYLMRNGKPWLPVMGEFHYTRVPEAQWEEQILKMKAAGVQIVATYVFWIHHEEIEGQFDWSGRRDLRHFVELCAKHGMYVYPRIGPWDHGEVRNGGFPDWLLQKTTKTRQNDPVFLSCVDTFYSEIAKQLKGLLWKDGGPVIGIQLENEYATRGPGAGEAYILKLKEMATKHGLDVPIYSVTGWDHAVVPKGEVVAVFGGYPDAPWDASLTDLPPEEVYTFRFGNRVTGNMGHIGSAQAGTTPPTSYDFPFMTAEMGGGVHGTYHRRPVIAPDDVAAMVPVMLGSGVNLYGSYMFQGGENPDGKLTTLQESQATGYPTDVPIKSYDFQAPLGEFGEERPVFRKLKIFNYFMNDFGSILAPMVAYPPSHLPASPADTTPVRISVRTDGTSGFLFFNNYIRNTPMQVRHAFQAIIKLPKGTIRVPEFPVDLPSGAYGIWPFDVTLDSIHLRYATAQLFTKTTDPTSATYYFVAPNGIPVQFAIDSASQLEHTSKNHSSTAKDGDVLKLRNLKPSTKPFFVANGTDGKLVKFVLLDEETAENSWKISTKNGERLLATPDQFYVNGSRVTLQSEGDPTFRFTILSDVVSEPTTTVPLKKLSARDDASIYSLSVQREAPKISFKQISAAGEVQPVKVGTPLPWRPHGVAIAPDNSAFSLAAKWNLSIPDSAWNGVHNLFLVAHYNGDVARLTSQGHLLEDIFYNGPPLHIGLDRFRDYITKKGLDLEILPRRADAPIFLEKPYRSSGDRSGQILELKSLFLIPLYQTDLIF